MIHMDYRTGKHASNKLRTCTQRAVANIPIGEIEHLFLRFPSSSFYHRRRKTNLNLPNSKIIKISLRGKFILTTSSLWLDLITTKWRRDQRNLFHDGNIIPP
jgi:hypothetical protein